MAYTGTNITMDPRPTPSIALRESNDSNGFFFMSLDTGKRLHCNKWTQLVITEDIIEAVHDLSQDDLVSPPYEPGFTLVDPSDPFQSTHPNQDNHDSITSSPLSTSDNSAILSAHVSSIPDDTSSIHSYNPHQDDDLPFNDESIQDSNHIQDSSPFQDSPPMQGSIHDSSSTRDSNSNDDSNQDTTSDDFSDMPAILPQAHFTNIDSADFTYNIADQCDISNLDVAIENLSNRHQTVAGNASPSSSSNDNDTSSSKSSSILPSLPYSHDEDHSHKLVQVGSQPFTTHEGYTTALKYIFTQMSATKGIAKHGEKAIASIFKELKQLNDAVERSRPGHAQMDPSNAGS